MMILRFINDMNSKRVLPFLLVCLTCFSWLQVQAQEPEPEQKPDGFVVDKIIGKVDNYIVIKSELERSYQDYLTNGGSPSQEARCHYLAMLIRSKLMLAKAEIDSVVVLDAEVDLNTQ